jgi:biotin synthase
MTASLWNRETITNLYDLPFLELVYQAQTVHRQHFDPQEIELCALLSIKSGACPEDCAYCPQSGHYKTGLKKEKLIDIQEVIKLATLAKKNGAIRFCMGAAWKNPPDKDFPKVLTMVKAVKELGLETCVTLGKLSEQQAQQLKEEGLDFYNHNLDTSPNYYPKIISTRTYQDRLDTLEKVDRAGINVCCGGILGLGESRQDRIDLLAQLANLPTPPSSVPINRLIPFKGTPLAENSQIENFEFIKTIAVARIIMPNSIIRLSAGRITMSEEMQAWCFMAGANSMWRGEKLLTAPNPKEDSDIQLFEKLNLKAKKRPKHVSEFPATTA